MSLLDLRQQASKVGDYESLIGDQLSLDQSVPYIGQGWDEYFDKLNDPDRHWSERYRDVSWLTPEQLEEAIQYYDAEEARLKGIMDPYVDDWNNLRSGTQEYADWAKNQYNTEFDKLVDRFNRADYLHYDRNDGSFSERQDFDLTPEMIERWRAGEDIFADYRGDDRSMQLLHSMAPGSASYVDPDNLSIHDQRRSPFEMGRPDDYISNLINQYRTTGEHGLKNVKYDRDWQDLQENWQNQFSPQYNAMVQSQADYDRIKDRSSQLRALKEQSDRFYDSGLHENYDDWMSLVSGGRNAGIHSLFPDNELFLWDGWSPEVAGNFSEDMTSLGKTVKDMVGMGLNPGMMLPSLMNLRDPWGRYMFVDGQYQDHPDIPATEDMRRYWDEYNQEGRYAPDLPEFVSEQQDSVPTTQSVQDEKAAQAQTIWDMVNENGTVEAEEGDPNDVNGDGWISPADALMLANPEEAEDKVWEWGKTLHPGYLKMQDEFQRRYEEQGWSGYEDSNYDPNQAHTMDIRSVYNPVTKQTWSGPSSAMPAEIRDSLAEGGGWVEGSIQDHILEGWSDPLYEHARTGGRINQIIGSLEKRLSENPDYYNTDWWREQLASTEPGNWIADYDANKDGAINQADLDMYRSQLDELGAPEGYRLPHSSVWTPGNIVGPPETAYGAIGNDPGNPEGIQAQDVGAFGVDSTTGVPFVFTRNVGAGPDATKAYANPEASVRWLLGAGDSTKDWHQGVVSGFVDPSTLTQEEYDFANDWWNQQIENNPSYAEGYGYLPSFESLADFEVGPTQRDPVDYIKQVAYDWERNFPDEEWAPHEDWANDPNRTWYTHNPMTGEYLDPQEQKYYSGYYGYGHQTGDGWVTGQGLPENLTALDVGTDFPEFSRRLHTDASVTENLIRNYSPEDEGIFDSSGNLNTSSTSTGTVDEDGGLFDSEGNLNTSSNVSGNTSTHRDLEEIIDSNRDNPDFIWDRDSNEDGTITPLDRIEDMKAAEQDNGGSTGGGDDLGGDNQQNNFGMKDEDIVAGLGREDTADLFHPYGSKEYNEKQGKSAFHKAFGLHRNTPTQNYITE